MRHTLPIAPQFYVTAPQPCPYLSGRMERKLFTALQGESLWLRAKTHAGRGTLAWSIDGKWYEPVGDTITFKRQWFENHKIALFTYNVNNRMGQVAYDWFFYRYAPGYPVQGSRHWRRSFTASW